MTAVNKALTRVERYFHVRKWFKDEYFVSDYISVRVNGEAMLDCGILFMTSVHCQATGVHNTSNRLIKTLKCFKCINICNLQIVFVLLIRLNKDTKTGNNIVEQFTPINVEFQVLQFYHCDR